MIRHRMDPLVRATAIGFLALLLVGTSAAQGAGMLSASQVTPGLGTLTESARIVAIARMVRNGQIRAPLSSSDGMAILQGTTGFIRAGAIGQLASLFKADLSAQEAAVILGPTLSEDHRHQAILVLVSAKRLRSSLGEEDAALLLQGTTGFIRAGAIGQLASLFKADLSAQEVTMILGPTLSEGNRVHAIAILARAKRFGTPLGEEAALLLKGITQGNRAAAIWELAPYLRANLPGLAIATILGRNGELTEGNRHNAIVGLARAGKLRACLSGDDMNLIMLGVTGPMQVTAKAAIADAAKPQCVTAVFSNPALLRVLNQTGSWEYQRAVAASSPISNLWGYKDGDGFSSSFTSSFEPIDSMKITIGNKTITLQAYPNVGQDGKYDFNGAFQCTALISEYLSLLGFRNAPLAIPNGREAVTALTTGANREFFSPIDSTVAPQPGSIISMETGTGGVPNKYGHVAIVKGATQISDNTIRVNLIEQNLHGVNGFPVNRTIELTRDATGAWSGTHAIVSGGNTYKVLNWTTPIALP